jgi:hypothetical protein
MICNHASIIKQRGSLPNGVLKHQCPKDGQFECPNLSASSPPHFPAVYHPKIQSSLCVLPIHSLHSTTLSCACWQSVVANTTTMHEWWILTSRPKCCVYRSAVAPGSKKAQPRAHESNSQLCILQINPLEVVHALDIPYSHHCHCRLSSHSQGR